MVRQPGARFGLAALVVASLTGVAFSQCEQAELTGSDGVAGDTFGERLAIDDPVAAVGAALSDLERGAVYVYRRDRVVWNEEQKVTAGDAAAGDRFGAAVAVEGDVLAVGAPRDSDDGAESGSVSVFRFDGATWGFEAKLTASDAQAGARFGQAVALNGDVLVVGALFDDAGFVDDGSAYVFRFDGSTWVEEQKLNASDAAADERFGLTVDVSGDRLVVGTQSLLIGGAYVFHFDGSAWSEEKKLTASDGAAGDRFGQDVAIDGVTVVCGAFGDETFTGAAYAYRFDGSKWGSEQKITASDGTVSDLFGASVAVDGSLLAVGASCDGFTEGDGCRGLGYVYQFDGSSWTGEQKVIPGDLAASDATGTDVAVDGNFVCAGSPGDDSGQGSMSIFAAGPAASWSNYGAGWPGTLGVPAFTASAAPVLGTNIDVFIGNSASTTTTALLLLGLTDATIPTQLGGTLLVVPARVLFLVVPPAGLTEAFPIRCQPPWAGLELYLQVLEDDAGASRGVSFSEGMSLVFGL